MKILVIDDEKGIQIVFKALLEERGYDVATVGCAAEGIELVKQNHYDIVFVDYKMPGNDGIWFMQNAKLPRTTKILLMTAFVNRQVINRMFSLGASGYLIKPFDDKDVFRHIEFFTGVKTEA